MNSVEAIPVCRKKTVLLEIVDGRTARFVTRRRRLAFGRKKASYLAIGKMKTAEREETEKTPSRNAK